MKQGRRKQKDAFKKLEEKRNYEPRIHHRSKVKARIRTFQVNKS